MVIVTNEKTGESWDFYLEPQLKKYLDTHVKIDLAKKDKDYVLLVDGYEGAGKSTFAQQIGRYVDSSLSLDRICMTASEFKEAVIKAEKNQCVIYDEAVTGMTAAGVITKVGRLIVSMMMQMRQKNLFVIVIIPSVFDLNKYSVLSRAKGLFHIYESKGKRGYFVGYNKKDTRMTYLLGKKTYSYKVKSRFTGRFYGKVVVDDELYRKKKEDALFLIEEDEEEGRYNLRNEVLYVMSKHLGVGGTGLSKILEEHGVRLGVATINKVLAKYALK